MIQTNLVFIILSIKFLFSNLNTTILTGYYFKDTRPRDRKSVEIKSTENVITSKMILSKMSQTRNQGLRTKLSMLKFENLKI